MKIADAVKLLRTENDYLILTHRNPDGDTLGSAAALCLALRAAGKTAALYPNSQIASKFNPYVEGLMSEDISAASHVIAVDVASESQFPDEFSGNVLLCIDHHPSNTGYAEYRILDADRASCGEIVYQIICRMNGGMDSDQATCLYMAVSSDTGAFLYDNTNAATFSCASQLLKYGARSMEINRLFFSKRPYSRLKLEGMIYSSLRYDTKRRIAVALITQAMLQSCCISERELDDVASLAARTEDCAASITLRELSNGTCKASIRSNGELDCTAVCSYFGGGGHVNAAGCSIPASPDRALELLLAVIDEVNQ